MTELNEYGQRITAAALALNLTVTDLGTKLDAMGLKADVALLDNEEMFKFGDFREVFKDRGIVSIRVAFKALKGGKTGDKQVVGEGADPRMELLKQAGFKLRPGDADTKLLLSLYVANKINDPVTNALKTRFGDQPIIAFDEDGTVNQTATLEYVSGLEQGFPASETVNINGRLVKLWPIGVVPDVLVDEDPLFPGSPLRNGVSLVNHRNWSKVSATNRQFCRLVVGHGDIDPDNHEAVLRLLERAQETDASKLCEVYPEVDLLFRDKAKRDELPKLKIELGQQAKAQNPFGVRRKY